MQVLGAAAWIVGEYCRPHLVTLAKRTGDRVWFDIIQVMSPLGCLQRLLSLLVHRLS